MDLRVELVKPGAVGDIGPGSDSFVILNPRMPASLHWTIWAMKSFYHDYFNATYPPMIGIWGPTNQPVTMDKRRSFGGVADFPKAPPDGGASGGRAWLIAIWLIAEDEFRKLPFGDFGVVNVFIPESEQRGELLSFVNAVVEETAPPTAFIDFLIESCPFTEEYASLIQYIYDIERQF